MLNINYYTIRDVIKKNSDGSWYIWTLVRKIKFNLR